MNRGLRDGKSRPTILVQRFGQAYPPEPNGTGTMYTRTPIGGTAGTVAVTPGDLRLNALPVDVALVIDALGVATTAGGAGSAFLGGIYDSDPATGMPRHLVAAGSAATTGIATNFASIGAATLTPGLWWFGGVFTGTAPTIRMVASQSPYIFCRTTNQNPASCLNYAGGYTSLPSTIAASPPIHTTNAWLIIGRIRGVQNRGIV